MQGESAATAGVSVGVISFHNSKETKAICNAVEALGHEPIWIRKENLTFEAGYGRVEPTPKPDILINRLLLHSDTVDDSLGALGLLRAYEEADIPIINPPDAVVTSTHKFASLCRLASQGFPIPPSTLAIGVSRLENAKIPSPPMKSPRSPTGETLYEDRFDAGTDGPERIVFKRPVGTHGGETQLVDPDGGIPSLATRGQGILQPMVSTPAADHEDLRLYVVGGECLGVMRRHAPEGEWRTNVAQGGRVRDATGDVPDRVVDIAVEAADALGLDIAGVDIIEGVEDWYILEVNVTAGFKGFFQATGISPAPAIAAHAIERAGGSVDPAAVERLSKTLDDSVPACKPAIETPPDPEEAVIGYTTTVRVAGQHQGSEVVAKSDTGATRTSIDTTLAGEIGAGPIVDHTNVKEAAGKRPIVPISIRINGYTHEIEANVRDRSGVNHDVLLGRDVLDHYSVRVRRRHDEDPSYDPEE